jgi:hypothetical protein
MAKNLDKAIDNVETTYKDLIEIANDMSSSYFKEVNEMISDLQKKVNTMGNDDIRLAIIHLSLKSFSLGEMKERTALKQEISETLRKEKYAQTFNSTEGSVGVRENTAVLESSEEIVTELIYDYVASAFKTKLDEVHRVVDSLKSILMSKMQELKITNSTLEAV